MNIRSSSAFETEKTGEILGCRFRLRPDWAKTIFLFGEMGVGKTTFLRGFARGLGIKESISSPTYALVAEYGMPENPEGMTTFAHFDLYRAKDASALSLMEVIETLEDPAIISAVEWSEHFPPDKLPPQRLEIHFHTPLKAERNARTLEITFYDRGIPTAKQIEALWETFEIPSHVRKHIQAVANVAVFFAEKLTTNGIPVNTELVRAGALLHDFVRVCNFKNLDTSCFHEEVTPQKTAVWSGLITKYGNRHHAEAGAEILRDLGFIAAADVVSHHNTSSALKELTLEEKCMLLGDRHVLHTTVVTLDKRMQDGIIRHDHNANPRAAEINKCIREILAEVCELAGIKSSELECIDRCIIRGCQSASASNSLSSIFSAKLIV